MRTKHSNISLLVILITLLLSTSAFGQYFNESIDLVFGDDVALNVQYTPSDGGQITTGYTVDPIGTKHVNLVKTDASGAVVWSKIMDIGGIDDQGNAVEVTASGDYILTGFFTDPFAGIKQLLVIRTDPFGGVLWTKAYPHAPFPAPGSFSEGYSIEESLSGDIIVAGKAFDPISGLNDLIVIRIDPAGTLLASAVYNIGWDEVAYTVKEDPMSGDILLAGYLTPFGRTDKSVLIGRLDPLLGLLWFFGYDTPADDVAYSLEVLPSGEIVVAGESNSYSNGKKDVYMQMVDPAGSLIWASIYGHKRDEIASSVELMSDGTLALTGYTTSVPGAIEQVYLMKTDLGGAKLMSRHFGTPYEADLGMSVKEDLSTGDVIIAGIEGNASSTPKDIYLIKTDAAGGEACGRNLKFLQLYVSPPQVGLWCVPFPAALELDPYATANDLGNALTDLCCDCPEMLVDFSASAITATVGATIDFTNLSDCIENYRWVIDGTLVSTATDYSHVFTSPGTYTVKLVGKLSGCPNVSLTQTIVISSLRDGSDESTAATPGTISTWPNPAASSLHVSAATAGYEGTVYLSLSDMSGRSVLDQEFTHTGGAFSKMLDVSQLPAGLYALTLHFGNEVSRSKLQILK